MLELTWSLVGWVAVVLIQAIVHFGIIGPRARRRKRQEKDAADRIEILETTCEPSSRTAPPSEHEDTLFSINDDRGIDPDERDTFEHIQQSYRQEEQEVPMRGPSPRHCLQRKFAASDREKVNVDDPAEDANGSCSSNSSEDSHYYLEDDCVDEDEQWRFELLRKYYSPSSSSMVLREDDPALEPSVLHGGVRRSSRREVKSAPVFPSTAESPVSSANKRMPVSHDQKSKTPPVATRNDRANELSAHRSLRQRVAASPYGSSSKHVRFAKEDSSVSAMNIATHVMQIPCA